MTHSDQDQDQYCFSGRTLLLFYPPLCTNENIATHLQIPNTVCRAQKCNKKISPKMCLTFGEGGLGQVRHVSLLARFFF